jgi:hypothetical protein
MHFFLIFPFSTNALADAFDLHNRQNLPIQLETAESLESKIFVALNHK